MGFNTSQLFFPSLLLILGTSYSWAQVQTFPSRLVLNETKRVGEMVIKGSEEGTQSYRLEPILFEMDEQGKLTILSDEDAKKHPQSLISMLRFSPREFSLPQGKTQVVRFRVLPTQPPKAGVYRTHVRIVPVIVPEKTTEAKKTVDEKGISLDIKMRLALAVPVYYHHTYKEPQVKFSNVKVLAHGAKEVPTLEASFEPLEMQPIYGDFYIVSGEPKTLDHQDPNVHGILRSLASYGKLRNVSIPFFDKYRGKALDALPKNLRLQFRKSLEEDMTLLQEVALDSKDLNPPVVSPPNAK